MEDEYESLPESISVAVHMMAGAVAGVSEHTCMYPVDFVKTRMQSLKYRIYCDYGLIKSLHSVARSEGVFQLYRGISLALCGAIPAHAFYFASYEASKNVLSKYFAASTSAQTPVNQNFIYVASAVSATLLHDAVMNPLEVLKQRIQMYHSPYSSIGQCFSTLVRKEGFLALYRSYPTTVLMNLPFQSIHFLSYELVSNFMNPKRNYDPLSHLLSGGFSGGLAAALTTPFDVCRTTINTQEECIAMKGDKCDCEVKPSPKNLKQAISTVYKCRGVSGYFQGLNARIIYQIPSTAICWSVYEFFKYILHESNIL